MNEHEFAARSEVELTTVHGLPAVRVVTKAASGLVFLQGAHVAAWQPAGQKPVIWLSENAVYAPGQALRGGIPICFPWFGANEQHADYPAHGFARTKEFTYRGARAAAQGDPELEFALLNDGQTESLFPYAFEVRLRVCFGRTLRLELTVTNRDARAFRCEEALHSYFTVSDVRRVGVLGLEGARYTDKVRAMGEFSETAAELRLSSETDRVYDSASTCTIRDPDGPRDILIEKANSASTVVWNPWSAKAARMTDFGGDAWPRMLCVESANVGKAAIALEPGASHTLRVAVSVSY